MFFKSFGGSEKMRITEMIVSVRAGDSEKVGQLLSKGVDELRSLQATCPSILTTVEQLLG